MSLSKEPTAKTQGDVSLVLGFLVFGPLVLGSLVLGSLPASAQHRPLTVQDPEVIGQGQVLVEAGAESGTHVKYPVSGLTGDRWALPVGVSIGLGPSVELQLAGGYQWLAIDRRDLAPLDDRVGSGDRTSDVIDVVVATKIRLFTEGSRRPALGLRLATELPNASNESGLGLDTLNFSASLLLGRTVGSTRIAANAGVVLLSDVLQGSLQQDAFVGGVSLTRALTPGLDVVGEFAGRKVLFADVPPIGAEPRAQLRGALRYTRGAWRADGGLIVGATRQDPDIGLTVGMTWVIDRR
jgi:hypothetical protein